MVFFLFLLATALLLWSLHRIDILEEQLFHSRRRVYELERAAAAQHGLNNLFAQAQREVLQRADRSPGWPV